MKIARLLPLLAALLLLSSFAAADEGEDDESDDDEGGDAGEGSGEVAAWMLGAGFIYVVVRQRLVRDRLFMAGLERKRYGALLKLALNGHMWLMVGATALAGYHGWLMAQSEGWLEGDSLSGLLALATMAYLSVTGILLWRRLPPDWVSRPLRKQARLAHVQRWVTVALLVTLALHLG
ncbi:MAG: hypothetical protein CL960_01265 [Euryarchaeota archaeon]|jgi:hypothetical protein|nr:hypothetical protein [Euryarchaeota archaeon]MDP6363520.1 hypothetical protein [Candidatus Poseidoniia archaeon]MDP6658550.1 hypothetical protein [Candidatus Poseidoniia archaeon]MDP6846873.1 hypothetical protein [Candidatus Poseidoniia archaeon]MDP7007081.1 hypothetical protein [Candidatus Poseidoniia archaeon]|tara:strand:- start:8400 stop:8933 length:534 start_codon:yes stop_codon:yes gene_type:complete